jgi:hypothetical protein
MLYWVIRQGSFNVLSNKKRYSIAAFNARDIGHSHII